MEIHHFLAGDGQRLIELFAEVLPDSPTATGLDVAATTEFLSDNRSFALGAYRNSVPVGLAWGLQMRSPSGRLTTYLHELDVVATQRRGGIGSALVHAAMKLARKNGSTKFWLSTGGHNEVAQALYETLGGDRKPRGDVNYWWDLD